MTNCIFCKIIDGAIPSAKVYEDEYVYAFMDITPVSKGHVLLIPKKHIENVYDFSEVEASRLFSVAPKIANALKAEFEPAGMNLLSNNGAPAGQSVFHFHLHFIPRYGDSDGFQPSWVTKETTYTPEKIIQFADNIRTTLEK